MAGRGGNPFDLTQRRAPVAAAHLAHEWTEAEQVQKLVGYIEVTEAFWEHIRVNDHVRYYTKAAGFRTGGFVIENPAARVDPENPGSTKKIIRLKNGFTPQAALWSVDYDEIDRIFVKSSAALIELKHDFDRAIIDINTNMNKIAQLIVSLRETKAG